MEQRERFFTSHLPAGARSSLEDQVSPVLDGRLMIVTHFVSEGRLEVSYRLFFFFKSWLTQFKSDHKKNNNPEGLLVIIFCSQLELGVEKKEMLSLDAFQF